MFMVHILCAHGYRVKLKPNARIPRRRDFVLEDPENGDDCHGNGRQRDIAMGGRTGRGAGSPAGRGSTFAGAGVRTERISGYWKEVE
jgi:hypothetical protein